MNYLLVTLLSLGALCAAVGQLSFKVGADGKQNLVDYFNIWIFLGLIFYGLGTVLWIYCLSKANLTFVYAFTGVTFALVYLLAGFFLGERLDVFGIFGTLLVVLGIGLIMSSKGNIIPHL